MEWQPIETAPKDGREVLISAPSGGVMVAWRSQTGAWVPLPRWLLIAITDAGEVPDHLPTLANPRCWMPLPQPPGQD